MITHHSQDTESFHPSRCRILCLIKTTSQGCCWGGGFASHLSVFPFCSSLPPWEISARWCALITLLSVWQMEQATSGSLAVAGEETLISQGLSGPSGSCSGWTKCSSTLAHHVLNNHLEPESGLLYWKWPHYEELSWCIGERIGRIEQTNIKRTKVFKIHGIYNCKVAC